ncbi:MAG TPA: recombinase family protein [Mycobacteriales bacterium]|nr:recombinase family protein [Mycobacteriales bacterium]
MGIYTRISRDAAGHELGVQRQEQDCRDLAKRLGWTVMKVYKENDTSAFKRQTVDLPGGGRALRVVRPEFRQMIDDLHEGRIDGLIAYDLDRVARDPRDLEDLIDLKEVKGCDVKSVTGSLRLDSDADVTMARVMVAIANKSSRDTSRRVARRCRQRAEEGGWHGGWAPYGYEFERDSSGAVIGLLVQPQRAAIVRESADRVLRGDTLYRIAKDLNARGVGTAPSANKPDGSRWGPRQIKRMLLSPAIIGYRSHNGTLHPATWPAILDDDTYKRVRDILTEPSRADRAGGFRSTARKQALTGIATCGCTCQGHPCGRRLYSQPAGGKSTLVCVAAHGGCGHVRINYDPLEAHVLRLVGERLDTVGPPVATDTGMSPDEEAALRADVEADEARLQQLQDDYMDGLFDRDGFQRQQDRLRDRLDDNRLRLADLQRDRIARDMPTTRAEFEAMWATIEDLDRRRAILGHFLADVVIHPHPKGVATRLSPKRHESDADYGTRCRDHHAAVLGVRVQAVYAGDVADRGTAAPTGRAG